jgi:hypothetical protein
MDDYATAYPFVPENYASQVLRPAAEDTRADLRPGPARNLRKHPNWSVRELDFGESGGLAGVAEDLPAIGAAFRGTRRPVAVAHEIKRSVHRLAPIVHRPCTTA